MTTTTFFVDVSQHDVSRRGKALDWKAIRQNTSQAMMARATYGDPQGFSPSTAYFSAFHKGARTAGMDLCGGYHNLIKGDQASINRQVEWFLRELDSVKADWAMLDIERYEELVANGLWPRFTDVLRFRDRWAKVAGGLVLTYYLPPWLWSGHLGSPDLRQLGGPLIASHYGSNLDGLPAAIYAARGGDTGAGWKAYGHVTPDVWQFGSDCDLPGASNKTDINAYRGDLDSLRALLTGRAPEIGDIMSVLVRQTGDTTRAVWLSTGGVFRRWVKNATELKAIIANAKAIGLVDGTIRDVPDLSPYGVDITTLTTPAATVDPAALAAELLAQSDGHVTVNITDGQLERVFRKVVGSVDGATPPTT